MLGIKKRSSEKQEKTKFRVKGPGMRHGVVELEVCGRIHQSNMDEFVGTLSIFEERPGRKHYINLGKAEDLCGRAVDEVIRMRSRFENRGELLDVIDISENLERRLRDDGLFDHFRPSIVGIYNILREEKLY